MAKRRSVLAAALAGTALLCSLLPYAACAPRITITEGGTPPRDTTTSTSVPGLGKTYGNFRLTSSYNTITPWSAAAIKARDNSKKAYKSQAPGTFDVATKTKANFIKAKALTTALGGIAGILPNAGANLKWFLDNTGKDRTINFANMLTGSIVAKRCRILDTNLAMAAAENLLLRGSAWLVTISEVGRTASLEYATQCAPLKAGDSDKKGVKDWWYAVGLYRTWTRASVTRTGNKFSMTMYYNMRDVYDWEPNSPKRGGFVTDGEMAQLHRWGYAQEYVINGVVTIKVDWTKGERIMQV